MQTVSTTRKTLPDNLPTESRKALEDMKSWKELVIRPSDKGSKFFILDREDYIQRVLVHLNDPSTFVIVQNKPEAIQQVTDAITDWTHKYSSEIGMTTSIRNLVIPNEHCKPGNNYINPKAHKPNKNYPGRLISTGCSSYTKNLSALTATELCKVDLQYVIKDTNHLLRQIRDINQLGILKNSKDVLHVSLDIVNMFPSISKIVGLDQCRMHLDKRDDPLFSTDCTQYY